MPRSNGNVPAYRLHKPSGQARVIINGEHIYLGKFGSQESHERYARLVAELATPGAGPTSRETPSGQDLTINEVLLLYTQFAETYYVRDGEKTKEFTAMGEALWPVKELYGSTPAREFGPKKLKTVRQHMINQDLSRGVINTRINRIKRVFKWAVAEELVPPSVHHGLQAVAGLRFGRTQARETEPVRPVPDLHVAAILPYLPPQIAAMVMIQRLTGMRPCEVVKMRPADIDTSETVWLYEPLDHKNRWRGHKKVVPLGPAAQEMLAPYMQRKGTAYLFSPKEVEAWRKKHRKPRQRKTKLYPCERKRVKQKKAASRRRKRKRPPRDRYDSHSYRRAIDYAFTRAEKEGFVIPRWFPYQLRHTRATEVRKAYGIEAAQVALGHARADVTEVYAEKNTEAAIRIARELG